MAEIKYFVKYGTYSKLIKPADKSKDSVLSAIEEKFKDILPKGTRRLQLYQNIFDDVFEWLDLDSFDEMPDCGRIQIQIDDDSPPAESGNSASSSPPPIPPVAGPSGSAGNGSDSSVRGAPTPASTNKTFPLFYNLPEFPPAVMEKLEEEGGAKYILTQKPQTMRFQIIQALYNQLVVCENGYVGAHYPIVLTKLISTYPGLADKPLRKDTKCNKSHFGSWRQQLKQKFKEGRRGIEGNSIIEEMKRKFGHAKGKRRRVEEGLSSGEDTEEDISPDIQRKRRKTEVLLLPSMGETQETIDAHMEAIKKEWAKSSPDMEIINSRMERTAVQRYDMYQDASVGAVGRVFETYPCLHDANQVIRDCERFYKVNPSKEKQRFFSHKAVLDCLLQKVLRAVPTENKPANMQSSPDEKQTVILANLPLLFRGKNGRKQTDGWLYIDKEVRGSGAGISVQTVGGDIYNENCRFKIMLEKRVLCSNAPSLSVAFDVLLSIIYLFNIVFPKEHIHAYRFLAEVISGFRCESEYTNPVQQLVNQMPDFETDCHCGKDGSNTPCPCNQAT